MSTMFQTIVDTTTCGTCGSKPGERCTKVTGSGDRKPMGQSHTSRVMASYPEYLRSIAETPEPTRDVHASCAHEAGICNAGQGTHPATSKATDEPELDEDAVLAVLDYFAHPAGRQAGGFVTSLLETMGRADLSNRAKLVAAFPEWGVPFAIAKDVAGGTDALAAQIGR